MRLEEKPFQLQDAFVVVAVMTGLTACQTGRTKEELAST